MTTSKDTATSDEPDFVLKHRITGAAFLIFFGVLVLPWLLSAPGQSSQANAESIDVNTLQTSREDIEQELLTAIENENIPEQDLEIYVSRITPLDAQVDEPKSSEPVNDVAIAVPVPEKVVAKPANKDVVESIPKPVENKPNEVVQHTTEQPKPEPEKEAPPQNRVEVGWVVQVGVFTDNKGAGKVVADLKSKGFEPSTTIVDTNLGKATGTRVWLGPYAQRVDAAKSKTTLKDKTGGDGFIRAYP